MSAGNCLDSCWGWCVLCFGFCSFVIVVVDVVWCWFLLMWWRLFVVLDLDVFWMFGGMFVFTCDFVFDFICRLGFVCLIWIEVRFMNVYRVLDCGILFVLIWVVCFDFVLFWYWGGLLCYVWDCGGFGVFGKRDLLWLIAYTYHIVALCLLICASCFVVGVLFGQQVLLFCWMEFCLQCCFYFMVTCFMAFVAFVCDCGLCFVLCVWCGYLYFVCINCLGNLFLTFWIGCCFAFVLSFYFGCLLFCLRVVYCQFVFTDLDLCCDCLREVVTF